MIVAQDLAEDQFAAVGKLAQGDEIVPIEAFHAAAQRRVAEGNCRLLDRAREDDIEADRPGAAIVNTPEHAADLARPGLRRDPLNGGVS